MEQLASFFIYFFFTMFFNKSCKSKVGTLTQTAWGLMIGGGLEAAEA